jgi:hypothetical protein
MDEQREPLAAGPGHDDQATRPPTEAPAPAAIPAAAIKALVKFNILGKALQVVAASGPPQVEVPTKALAEVLAKHRQAGVLRIEPPRVPRLSPEPVRTQQPPSTVLPQVLIKPVPVPKIDLGPMQRQLAPLRKAAQHIKLPPAAARNIRETAEAFRRANPHVLRDVIRANPPYQRLQRETRRRGDRIRPTQGRSREAACGARRIAGSRRSRSSGTRSRARSPGSRASSKGESDHEQLAALGRLRERRRP